MDPAVRIEPSTRTVPFALTVRLFEVATVSMLLRVSVLPVTAAITFVRLAMLIVPVLVLSPLMLRNALVLAFSPDFKSISPGWAFSFLRLGPLTIDLVRISALAASLALLGALAYVLNRTRIGRVIRATAQQELAARLCGVNARHVYAVTFGVSAAFAGASGAILGIVLPFSPPDESNWTLNAFVVVVLGGVGSPSGALLGGLLLGLISTATSQLIGLAFPNVMMFLILVLMLMAM
jgi:branched-chain amino acid transport system permease protein